MTIEAKIYELALANGFKLKQQPDGTMGLNPYVYDFAKALINDLTPAIQDGNNIKIKAMITILEDVEESAEEVRVIVKQIKADGSVDIGVESLCDLALEKLG